MGCSVRQLASEFLLGEPLFEDVPGIEAGGQFEDVPQRRGRIDVGPGMETGRISSCFDARETRFLELSEGLVEVLHSDMSQVVDALAVLVQEIAVDAFPLERFEQFHHHLSQHGEGGLEAVLDRLPMVGELVHLGGDLEDVPGVDPQEVSLRCLRSPVSADASIIGGLKTSVKMSAVVTVRVMSGIRRERNHRDGKRNRYWCCIGNR